MRIYLETSTVNFLFAEDDPERRDATETFWRWLRLSGQSAFTSEVALAEIARAPAAKREKLLGAFRDVDAEVLALDPAAIGFADRLVGMGAVPARFLLDARHVAVAVVAGMDVLASWNLEHIVKLKTQRAVSQLCVEYGLKPVQIHTPQEIVP
jgi:hypothetical protein